MLERFKISRMTLVAAIYCILFSILVSRLYTLQIVKGEEYEQKGTQKYIKQSNIVSTRGSIFDRNGNVLATNRISYSITMVDSGQYNSNREKQLALNGILYQILNTLEKNKEGINQEFNIGLDEQNNYMFTVGGSKLKRFKADIYGKSKIQDLTEEELAATATDIMEYLCSDSKFALFGTGGQSYTTEELDKYGGSKEYTKQQLLDLVGLRYMLSLNTYKKYNPITIAYDVSEQTMAYVLENQAKLTGVEVEVVPVREYQGGEAFSHIIGYTGTVSAEELEQLNESGSEYTSDSIVGKTGIEKYMDSTLRGENGLEEFTVNEKGHVVGEKLVLKEATSGNDVYLSVDMELQIAAYNMLERKLADILLDNIINAKTFDKSKVKESSDIRIPIYDVYVAFIHNNIIDIDKMALEQASTLEKNIYKRFEERKIRLLEQIYDELATKGTTYNGLDKELQEYESYIVNTVLMEKLELFQKDKMNTNAKEYLDWKAGSTSLKSYLEFCLNEGWIDIDKLLIDNQYYEGEKVYHLLIQKVIDYVVEDTQFDKLVYKYLIQSDRITGKEIGLLLYEQNVLSKEDKDYAMLKDNRITAFQFMRNKIEALEITPAMLALDPCSGSAVITDPGTGKVLACVSYPGYDHNRLANDMDVEYYMQLNMDQSLPLYNRATMQLSAPGSTFKPITVIAGLEEEVIDYNTSIYCDGVFDKLSTHLRCWKRSGHGPVNDIASALELSCNDYLCDIAYRLGTKEGNGYSEVQAMNRLIEYAKLFDLDKKSGIEIAESEPQISDEIAIASAIGQGTHNFSTVQLARYVTTLANRGTSYQVSLIDGVGNGEHVEKKETAVESNVLLSSRIWEGISNGLELFASTDRILNSLDIKVAGKTGTAQEAKNRPDHALFVGYAPATNPEIAVAVRITNGYKSANAVEVTKEIFEYYFNMN